MASTTYIGDKSKEYASSLPATVFFPSLKVSDFQKELGFKEDFSEEAILQQMTLDRWNVHKQLTRLSAEHITLEAFSEFKFGDSTTAERFYKQAVFTLTARNLIDLQLTTDATKESADRQSALLEQTDRLIALHRMAIDTLIDPSNGEYTFLVV